MIKLLALFVMLGSQANAYMLTYKIANPDAEAILVRVEAATGLNFQGKCAPATPTKARDCSLPIHGSISTDGRDVVVVVYQKKPAGEKRAVATPVISAALKNLIDTAVKGVSQ